MRDRQNIICDVNNAEYRTYKHSGLNLDNLSKKDLLKYLMKLCDNSRKLSEKYYKDNKILMCNISFHTAKFYKSFSYAYRIYTREQILEGITASLFKIKKLLKTGKTIVFILVIKYNINMEVVEMLMAKLESLEYKTLLNIYNKYWSGDFSKDAIIKHIASYIIQYYKFRSYTDKINFRLKAHNLINEIKKA